MKKLIFLLLVSLVLAKCNSSSEYSYDLIITNVNLIDGTGAALVKRVNIYVKDRVITKIDSGYIEGKGEMVDGTGKFVIPGLFDCHVHTTDFNRDFPKLMHYGVTSVFIPGGSTCTNDYFADMRAVGNQDSIPVPRVFHTSQHFTMEGRHPVKTYASPRWVDGETVFFLRDTAQIAQIVKRVAQYPILGIKLTIEDGPAPPFVERIPQEFINKTVKEASKYGLEVFAHASDNEEFLMAVRGGAQNIIHFVGIDIDWGDSVHQVAVETLLSRDASIVTTLMIDKSFIYALNPDWLEVPALNQAYPADTLRKLLTPGAIAFAQRMEKMTKEEYGLDSVSMESIFQPKVEDIQKLIDLGMNMVLGTDAGNDFNFHGYSLHEEMQLLQMGGMAPIDIIKMGTLNAAKMMHAEDSLGSIEVGKLADMILLDQNPLSEIENTLTINTVFKSGQIQERINN
ncbi:MAG: amidohydrolase family protein [Ekhidna sp.]|uniref:amidohydrolase family protein n=1 Tax=Ekhidna sp. TaxID=2608089 RepID=UPI0032F01BD5